MMQALELGASLYVPATRPELAAILRTTRTLRDGLTRGTAVLPGRSKGGGVPSP